VANILNIRAARSCSLTIQPIVFVLVFRTSSAVRSTPHRSVAFRTSIPRRDLVQTVVFNADHRGGFVDRPHPD
jgi:hypothetical protein